MPLMRGRKRRAEPDPESEADSSAASPEPPAQRRRTSPANDAADESDHGREEGAADSSHGQLVKKMVRLALACEYQRKPIRRMDISEKVLGSGAGRRFKQIFNAAQVELRSVFGMEMVELPGRERVTVAQKRAAPKSQSQTTKPTAAWVLISVLPPAYHDPEILPPSAAPTSDEEAKYTSVYTLLVSLILLSGGSLPASKMERYLRRLGIEDNAPMGAPGGGQEKTEKLLKRIEKDGYIVKIKEASGTGEDDVYWTVGPRGKVEVGEGGVEGLVKAVYGEMNGEEEEELERRIARSLGWGEERPPATQNGVEKTKGRRRKDEEEQVEQEEEEESSDEN